MAIKINCDRCNKQLVPHETIQVEARGLTNNVMVDFQYDLCRECRLEFISWVQSDTENHAS